MCNRVLFLSYFLLIDWMDIGPVGGEGKAHAIQWMRK